MTRLHLLFATLAVGAVIGSAAPAQAVTMTFSGLSGSPNSYTETGMRVRSMYGGGSGHLHSSSQRLSNHTGCCSSPYRWTLTSGGTFDFNSFQNVSASGTFTSSKGGSQGITGGTNTFTGTQWTGVSWVEWGGNGLIDNVVWNQCNANVANAGGPYTVAEGGTTTVVGSGSAPGQSVVLNWDFSGNGVYNDASGASPTLNAGTFSWDGTTTRTITLQVSCASGGGGLTSNATVNVTNVPPTVTGSIPAASNEGDAVSFTATVVDPGPETHTWLWTFGDGNTSTQQNPTHTYLDDGNYTVTVQVDDGEATDTATSIIAVANLAPTVQAWSGPSAGDEGSLLSYAAAGYDPGPVDQANLAYEWDWGDGTTDATASASHIWADDGTYSVTVTVSDPQAATGTSTFSVVIGNVAPTITSSPPLFVQEGQTYTYNPTAVDPGTDAPFWTLGSGAPAGMTIGSGSGAIVWTPTFSQGGANPVELTVSDGDGGFDTQSWSIEVSFLDADNDSMADQWETDNGLDPTDPSDASLDPDADGLTNLEEFQGGTGPNSFDGPDVPVPTAPLAGAESTNALPTLEWLDATDPNGDPLTYDVEVWSDATTTTLLDSATGVQPGGGGASSWRIRTILAENSEGHWRVRAADAHVAGGWSTLEWFFISTYNEAPGVPVPQYPVGGEWVGDASPALSWSQSVDPDRDPITYEIRLRDADGAEVTSGSVSGDARATEWTVDVVLDDDAGYAWDVRAVDDEGLPSAWSAEAPFFASGDNEAPDDVVWVSPLDGDQVSTRSPVLRATESVDPEGSPVEYVFELDLVDTFDGEDLVAGTVGHVGAGEAVWPLADDGIELTSNATWFARVRAEDEDGIGSPWATISFLVRGGNDAPPTPTLLSPEDGAVVTSKVPVFAVSNELDPEGDAVSYQLRVFADRVGAGVVAESGLVDEGSGPDGTDEQTTWQVPVELGGDFFWTARAVDARGAASEWAEPFAITTGDALAGCEDCESSLSGAARNRPGGAAAIVALALGFALRRRRQGR